MTVCAHRAQLRQPRYHQTKRKGYGRAPTAPCSLFPYRGRYESAHTTSLANPDTLKEARP